VRGASPSAANAAGTREPRFGCRHRTSRSRVRWLRVVCHSRATRPPLGNRGIHSRPLWRLRTRSRGFGSRLSIANPRRDPGWRCHCHEAWTGSGQIKAVGATCGPPRPERLVVVAQGQMDRPACRPPETRRRILGKKFTTTQVADETTPLLVNHFITRGG